jgi:hypothetical protein
MTITDQTTYIEVVDNYGMKICLPKNACWIGEESNSYVTITSRDQLSLSFIYTDVTNITATSAADLIDQLSLIFYS